MVIFGISVLIVLYILWSMYAVATFIEEYKNPFYIAPLSSFMWCGLTVTLLIMFALFLITIKSC